MNRLYIITTTRSDYGANKYIIDELERQSVKHLHLDYRLSYTEELIKEMHNIIKKFNNDIIKHKIKNIFILGDRWETLQLAMVAKLYNINIYHQGGGEVTRGAYDDLFRNAISQLSDHHFVITENAKQNLYKQGILDNVYVCGSPRLDIDKSKLKKYKYKNKTGLIIYHPTTKYNNNTEILTLIDALRYFDMDYIIVYPNLDKGSQDIIKVIERLGEIDNVSIRNAMPLDEYMNVLNSVDVMIGNSSAGIIETVTYDLPTVNIGDRQKGRDCNVNVLHAKCEKHDIIEKIDIALSDEYRALCNGMVNKFGDGKSSEKIVNIIRES